MGESCDVATMGLFFAGQGIATIEIMAGCRVICCPRSK